MTDRHHPEIRSKNMAAIRGKDTKPELFIRKLLHANGFRYTLNNSKLAGKPDIVFPKYRAVIFVHGCFWHVHNCPAFKWPSTREEWWKEKLSRNQVRDRKNLKELINQGWRIAIVWECALKGKYRQQPDRLIRQLSDWLKSDRKHLTLSGQHN